MEAQQAERHVHAAPPLQQQEQAYDYYHFSKYCSDNEGQAEREREQKDHQQQDQQQAAGEQRVQLGPRSGSRSRSGSSTWWEPARFLYSSSVSYAQEHSSCTTPGSSDSSTASSSRSRERRLFPHSASSMVPQQPSSNDSGGGSCGGSGSRQQSGRPGSSGEEDEEEEEEGRQQPQTHRQAALLLLKQQQQQQQPEICHYRYSCSYQQPEDCSERYGQRQQQDSHSIKHQQQQRDRHLQGKEGGGAADEDVESHNSSRGYHHRPHKRHSGYQQQQTNGKEGDSPLGGSSSSRGGLLHPAKPQKLREKKAGEEETARSRRRFEHQHQQQQQQQRDAKQGYISSFRSSTSRTSGHGAQAVVYQWQRRVVAEQATPHNAPQQKQQQAVVGQQQQQQQKLEQEDNGKEDEEKDQKAQLLDKKEGGMQSETETYAIPYGVRRQQGAARINGCITQEACPCDEVEEGEGGEEGPGKAQQSRQQQTGQKQQQQRPPWERQHQQKHQQRQERQQQQQKQHQQKYQPRHQQKQFLHKQKQQQGSCDTLSRSTSPTALEEGQQFVKPKQQHHSDSCLEKDAEAAAGQTDCLVSTHNVSLQAEEAVCAWLFDILVAHLEGSKGQPVPPEPIKRMHEERVRCPAFVTWMKKKGENSSFERVDVELRGCIGSLSPIPVLEIGEYALTSALRDKRFRPIALREVPYLACYVSLLHSYEDVKHPLDWEIGVHGTTIKFFASDGQTYTATYLPEVAKELGMTQREALTSLIRKSGYPGAIPENFMSRLSVTRYRSSQARLDYDTYLSRYGRYVST